MLMQRKFDAGGNCTHVAIKHTGTSPEQNFSHRLVEQAAADGWMAVAEGKLTVKTDGEPLVYTLKREPGYYCKSSGVRIPISAAAWSRVVATGRGDLSAREARAWLAKHHKAQDDYEVTMAYECVLSDEQHQLLKKGA